MPHQSQFRIDNDTNYTVRVIISSKEGHLAKAFRYASNATTVLSVAVDVVNIVDGYGSSGGDGGTTRSPVPKEPLRADLKSQTYFCSTAYNCKAHHECEIIRVGANGGEEHVILHVTTSPDQGGVQKFFVSQMQNDFKPK